MTLCFQLFLLTKHNIVFYTMYQNSTPVVGAVIVANTAIPKEELPSNTMYDLFFYLSLYSVVANADVVCATTIDADPVKAYFYES